MRVQATVGLYQTQASAFQDSITSDCMVVAYDILIT